MRRGWVVVASGFALVGALASGCGRKSLREADATGAGGSGEIDGRPIDAPLDARFSPGRSFVVTSQLQTDGGVSPTHTFTMVLNADQSMAILGAYGGGATIGLQQTADGGFHLVDVSIPITTNDACPRETVEYDDLSFTLDASNKLTGTGRGTLVTSEGELVITKPTTMSLTGVPDAVGPTLGIVGHGDLTDPFTAISVPAPEPLPDDASLYLRSDSGDSFMLTVSPEDRSFTFWKPSVLLRYGTTYTLDIGAIADFAGNRGMGTGNLSFTTRPLPPLVAEDGFESVTETTLGGAEVLAGSGAPTISGSRSLYIPPLATYGTVGTQISLRLPIVRGDTVVRFSFRPVMLNPTYDSGAQFEVASVHGTIVRAILPVASGPETPAVIDQTNVSLGPVMQAAINLPADAAGEVIVVRTTFGPPCDPAPVSGPPGIIIDDLRAE